MGKRRVNFQRCWLPVSRIGLHRRGVERVNCGPKLLDLGEKGVYSSYTWLGLSGPYTFLYGSREASLGRSTRSIKLQETIYEEQRSDIPQEIFTLQQRH